MFEFDDHDQLPVELLISKLILGMTEFFRLFAVSFPCVCLPGLFHGRVQPGISALVHCTGWSTYNHGLFDLVCFRLIGSDWQDPATAH